jgi:hypothetical protein
LLKTIIGMPEGGGIKVSWALVMTLLLAATLSAASCGDNTNVTAANQSLVRVSVDAPDTAKSGSSFDVQVRALNVGVANIHDGHVTITLPSPLTVIAADASAGTTTTFTNGIAGGTVQWDLRTLDSNSQSKIDITTMGVLGATEGTKRLTVVASMTAQGINPGDAIAQDDVTLLQ